MDQSFLWDAISPLDGRYESRLQDVKPFVSEAGLIRYRIQVEAAWLLALAQEPLIGWAPSKDILDVLKKYSKEVPLSAVGRVKTWESTTNHDVKAVEYALRDLLLEVGAAPRDLAMIHFACTSEDINNLSYAIMLRTTRDQVLLPWMDSVIETLTQMSEALASTPMLSRTHGQTASPTTLGKELAVFAHRFQRQRLQLLAARFDGKMSGAVGNYNAHIAAYPELDWPVFVKGFIEGRLGLHHNPLTTQIENHDGFVEYCDMIRRFSTIAIDLCRDMWGYISIGYFKQTLKAGEVGSSTMPHKVNPIDFENAEGNFGLACSFASHFGDKLPISRWQRDLSDSTVLRSFGSFAGHFLLGLKSLHKGLSKVTVDHVRLEKDLEESYEVLGEAIQTVMRRRGIPDAYERLKAATRGQAVSSQSLNDLVESIKELTPEDKKYLLGLSPSGYTGLASRLALEWVAEWREAVRSKT
ncbi:MAG: adenylosuccinate lyase [Pseudomonadota bacterium]